MKLEVGDLFEREKADWIRAKLPLYETVWSEFIGHDGKGRPLEIPGLNADQEARRRTFYQAHYSMGLYCYFMDMQCEGLLAAENSPLKIEGYLADFEAFVNFITYVGQVYDMVEDISAALRHPAGVISAVRPFYGVRSHAIHAARIPLQHDGLALKIPPISGLNKAEGEWHDQTTWDEVDPSRFVYLKDFCGEHRSALFKALNDEVYPRVRSAAHAFFGRPVEEPKVPVVVIHQAGSNYVVPSISAFDTDGSISGFRG